MNSFTGPHSNVGSFIFKDQFRNSSPHHPQSPPTTSYFCSTCHSSKHDSSSCPYYYTRWSPERFRGSSSQTDLVASDFITSHELNDQGYMGASKLSYEPKLECTQHSPTYVDEDRLATIVQETLTSSFTGIARELDKVTMMMMDIPSIQSQPRECDIFASRYENDPSVGVYPSCFEASPYQENLREVNDIVSFGFENQETIHIEDLVEIIGDDPSFSSSCPPSSFPCSPIAPRDTPIGILNEPNCFIFPRSLVDLGVDKQIEELLEEPGLHEVETTPSSCEHDEPMLVESQLIVPPPSTLYSPPPSYSYTPHFYPP